MTAYCHRDDAVIVKKGEGRQSERDERALQQALQVSAVNALHSRPS